MEPIQASALSAVRSIQHSEVVRSQVAFSLFFHSTTLDLVLFFSFNLITHSEVSTSQLKASTTPSASLSLILSLSRPASLSPTHPLSLLCTLSLHLSLSPSPSLTLSLSLPHLLSPSLSLLTFSLSLPHLLSPSPSLSLSPTTSLPTNPASRAATRC